MTYLASPYQPFPLVQPVCGWCHCAPCQCERIRLEQCACRGTIAARSDDHQDQVRAVLEHNATALHQAWRER